MPIPTDTPTDAQVLAVDLDAIPLPVVMRIVREVCGSLIECLCPNCQAYSIIYDFNALNPKCYHCGHVDRLPAFVGTLEKWRSDHRSKASTPLELDAGA